MTGGASGDRSMRNEARLRMPVALETESMEPRLNASYQVGALALVAHDAVLETFAIREIVVAYQTIDVHMLAMRKVQRQRIRA